MADSALVTLTISELASRIKAKAISPVELTEAALAQADRLQPTLNTFITILHEQARRQAKEQEAALMRGEYRGPLHGIPIGIKDNIATAGIRTRMQEEIEWLIVEVDSALHNERVTVNGDEFSRCETSNPHFLL